MASRRILLSLSSARSGAARAAAWPAQSPDLLESLLHVGLPASRWWPSRTSGVAGSCLAWAGSRPACLAGVRCLAAAGQRPAGMPPEVGWWEMTPG
jgi:hypothetical protein